MPMILVKQPPKEEELESSMLRNVIRANLDSRNLIHEAIDLIEEDQGEGDGLYEETDVDEELESRAQSNSTPKPKKEYVENYEI